MRRTLGGVVVVMAAMVAIDYVLGTTADSLNAYEVLRRSLRLPVASVSDRFVVGQESLGRFALAWAWLLWMTVATTASFAIGWLARIGWGTSAVARGRREQKGSGMSFQNKKVLVTGASRGIGRALAEQLAGAGADVMICGLDASRLEAVARELGVRAIRCDVSSAEDRARLEQAIRGELGGLDILINNAGVQIEQDVVDGLDPARVAREVGINLVAPIQLTSLLLPHLLASADPQIVNMSSGLAIAPSPRSPVYAASKAGLSAWTHALRLQLADTPVRVTEVVPPVVATDMTAGRQAGAVSADHVAAAALDALARRQERLAIGKVRALDFIDRLSPRLARRIMAKR